MKKKQYFYKNHTNLFWIISSCILMIPFFFSNFVPSTDLPQHLCQIQELKEVLSGSNKHLEINWLAPNNLIYILLFIIRLFFHPLMAGKIVLMILILLWNGAIFFLAKKRERPFENAILASAICFNFLVYWGFLNFLIGFPFYILFVTHSIKPIDKKNWLILFLLTFILFMSHALWFLIGAMSLAILILIDWKSIKIALTQLSVFAPMVIIAGIWYPTLAKTRQDSGADVSAYWLNSFSARLSPGYITDAIFGGLISSLEIVVSSLIFIWIFLSLYSNRNKLSSKTDKPLLACALLFICIMLFAPETYMNTLYFSQRWFPCGMILLILSLPVPAFNKNISLSAIALFILMILMADTARGWYLFEKKELTGIEKAITMLPENKRVLGLDFVKSSQYIKNWPFLQLYSYCQAIRNADLNFSFTEHGSGIVRYKEFQQKKWTPALEWMPEKVLDKDFKYFDYALINGKEDFHSKVLLFPYLTPVTSNGRFRLYKIDKNKIPE